MFTSNIIDDTELERIVEALLVASVAVKNIAPLGDDLAQIKAQRLADHLVGIAHRIPSLSPPVGGGLLVNKGYSDD